MRFGEPPPPGFPLMNKYPVSTRPVRKTIRSFNSLSGPIWRYLFHHNLLWSPGCKSALSREHRAGVVRNRALLSRYSEMVFKNPTLDARPSAHAGWHSRQRRSLKPTSRLQTRHCDDRKDPLAAKFFRSSITARWKWGRKIWIHPPEPCAGRFD